MVTAISPDMTNFSLPLHYFKYISDGIELLKGQN